MMDLNRVLVRAKIEFDIVRVRLRVTLKGFSYG